MERIILPNFNIYDVATIIDTVWFWWWDTCIDQCNRIENSQRYAQWIVDKDAEAIGWKKVLFKKWY